MKSSNKNFNLKNIINGIFIGASNVIPGVSGGTVAVILGIYEALIDSVKNIRHDFKKNIMYLIQIGIGAVIGILLFSSMISTLLDKYTIAVNYLFVGLVIGSISLLFSKFEDKKMTLSKISGFILGVGFVFMISTIGAMMSVDGTESIKTGLSSYITLGFAGFIAAFTMVLPGVSGSLTLVMLGMYDDFVNAISTFNIPILFVCGIGVLIGLLVTVKLISFLLKKYNDITYAAILGLVMGSILIIVFNNPVGSSFVVALVSIITGALITAMLSKLSR